MLALAAEPVQEFPGIDAGVVAVVEDQPYRVVAHGLHGGDVDQALASHELPLRGLVTLDLRTRALDAQVFGVQVGRRAVLEGDEEQALGAAEADFGCSWHVKFRRCGAPLRAA